MMSKLFWNIMEIVSVSISVILPLLLVIAFFTLLERKIMASLQRRIGPNIHGYYGTLQPLIDGLKLLWKELLIPAKANFYLFIFSPLFMMSLSFSLWAILPLSFTFTMFDSKLSLITFFVISSINVYNIILAGWASNSKYAFLGSVRAMGQMFSYELVLGFVLLFMLLTVGSLRIYDIVIKQYYSGYLFWPLLPFAIIFFISLLMETNRSPFDLAEAESELVAGYNVEYSSIMFAMFFLGEYCNILAMSSIWSLLFWGGFIANYFGVGVFIIKILTLCFIFVFIRSLLPRYRIDQLIYIGWHAMLPVSLGLCIFLIFLFSIFNIFPKNATYFFTAVLENKELNQVYSRWENFKKKDDFDAFYEYLSKEIEYCITEQRFRREELPDKPKFLHLLATMIFPDQLSYSSYMSARQFRLEYGDPRLADERIDIMNGLRFARARYNMALRFAEWLVTPVGRLPHGWTELQYTDFISGGKLLAFYQTSSRSFIPANFTVPLALDSLDKMYVHGRFELPSILQNNRFLIAPSKYALLSPEAQAKIDLESPRVHNRDRARVNWINNYSDALDYEYLETKQLNKRFKTPVDTGHIKEVLGDFDLLEEKRKLRNRNRAIAELQIYNKKFDLSKLFSQEQLDKSPEMCSLYLHSWADAGRRKHALLNKAKDVCPLYYPDDDVTNYLMWYVMDRQYDK